MTGEDRVMDTTCRDRIVEELRKTCKEREVKGFWKLRKFELIEKCCPAVLLEGGEHRKEADDVRQYHGVLSDSRAVSSLSFDKGTITTLEKIREEGEEDEDKKFIRFYRDGKAGYVENKRAMKYKTEERVAPTDDWLYLLKGMARNVALDGIIKNGKTSDDFRCADKNWSHELIAGNSFYKGDMNFLKKFEEIGFHGNATVKCSTSYCADFAVRGAYFDLRYNDLDRVPGCIENARFLESLDLRDNHIRKITNLDNLGALKILRLSSNLIKKIAGIDKLKELKLLALDINQLKKLEGLENLDNLRTLSIADNQIKKIEGLDNLKNLETLSLSSNPVKKIEGLDKLKELFMLSLENTALEPGDCEKFKESKDTPMILDCD
jgi:hypothetical protein